MEEEDVNVKDAHEERKVKASVSLMAVDAFVDPRDVQIFSVVWDSVFATVAANAVVYQVVRKAWYDRSYVQRMVASASVKLKIV